MPRPRKGARVLPPRLVSGKHRRDGQNCWRVITVDRVGRTNTQHFGDKATADLFHKVQEQNLVRREGITVERAIVAYKQRRMLTENKNLSNSVVVRSDR